jgi:hypothetical protein
MTVILAGAHVRIGNHKFDPVTLEETGYLAFTAEGSVTDPTSVLLTVRRPNRVTRVYAWPTPDVGQFPLEKDEAEDGRFYVDEEVDQVGRWMWRLIGSGACEAVDEGTFYVSRSRVV